MRIKQKRYKIGQLGTIPSKNTPIGGITRCGPIKRKERKTGNKHLQLLRMLGYRKKNFPHEILVEAADRLNKIFKNTVTLTKLPSTAITLACNLELSKAEHGKRRY